ncbi:MULTISPECIES: hypothetical protein [unclassified Akkermansia]|nr:MULTISPECIES: hypothetical protein [unclassified Akkermansia]
MMQAFLLQTLLIPKIIIDAGFQSRLFPGSRANRLFPTQGPQQTVFSPRDDFRLLRTLFPGLSFRQFGVASGI